MIEILRQADGVIPVWEWLFIIYFALLAASYLVLDLIALASLSKYLPEHTLDRLPEGYTGFEPGISLLAPAYNEETTIAGSIRSLLQVTYAEYEVIVVNDGSKDRTLEVLIGEFSLTLFPEVYQMRIPTKAIRGVYRSHQYPNLRVVDKENGGKADALNVGVNLSKYALFCSLDADSIVQRDGLQRIVQPFLHDPTTVACGGTIRIANGCEVSGGFLVKVGLPTNWIARFQIVEYIRAFFFGRLGWSPMNAMLIISGAFGLFRKDVVLTVGGYRTETIGEDMELVVRMHRLLRESRTPYRITFVPDPICWTEAPEDLCTLRNQRIRWQRGLCESLFLNRELLFHPRGGAVGWLSFPFAILFECLSPVIVVIGYVSLIACFALRLISLEAVTAFLLADVGLGMVVSVSALLLEELSFHIYPKPAHALLLFAVAVVENVGYRQLNSIWRLIGLVRWISGAKASWGQMTRVASWQSR
jgi:cellulose synthase/poly-beta-1,6-N-acetylglucosamine synthase-like glycosyltransferase